MKKSVFERIIEAVKKDGATYRLVGIEKDPSSTHLGKMIIELTWPTSQWQGGGVPNLSRVSGIPENEISAINKSGLYTGTAFLEEFAVDLELARKLAPGSTNNGFLTW